VLDMGETVGIAEAGRRLGALVDRVLEGERVTVTRRGETVAIIGRAPDESHAGLGAYAGALAAWPQLDEAVGLTLTGRPLARERQIPELD
jgi:prevent-host-death family protein